MSEQSDIPAPTPSDDVVPYQERLEFVIDKRVGEKLNALINQTDVTDDKYHLIMLYFSTGGSTAFMDIKAEGELSARGSALVPVTAGASLTVLHTWTRENQSGAIIVQIAKVADGDGIPVVPGTPISVIATVAANGDTTAPANPAGWTVASPSDNSLTLIPAAAGHYQITAFFAGDE